MIREPQKSGSYGSRSLDCRSAIEPPVMSMLGGSRVAFIDFHSLLHAILPAARSVGWDETEVQSALEDLVQHLRVSSR